MRKAFYPGSFDPVTNGHLDVIERAARLFDEVTVVVMTNYKKVGKTSFTEEERAELIRKCTGNIPNVKVDFYDGLLVDYARDNDMTVCVKGLRVMSDFENEFQQAIANRHMNQDLDTVFLPCQDKNMFLSSSLVKQIALMGGDITGFVPEEIKEDITLKLRKGNGNGTD